MADVPGQQRLRRGKYTIGEGSAREMPPVPFVQRAAVDYTKRTGVGRYMAHQQYKALATSQVDPERGFATALAYRDAEKRSEDPHIRASYEAMRQATNDQFEHMTRPAHLGGMGMKVEVTDHDPYPSPAHMAEDVSKGRIKVLSTKVTGGHGYFSDEENDRFRAVHDVFGHAAIGRGFTRHGEEAAYLHHRQMYPDAAHAALASETRGQNSYLNFHPQNPGFPNQSDKLIGLPSWASETGPLQPPAPTQSRTANFHQGRLF
jgi:hypothetical protein